MVDNQRQQKPNKAMWLSVIPGLGQLYNKQIVKGGILLVVFLLELLEIVVLGIPALTGLYSLGSVPMQDHSLFMLIKGGHAINYPSLICYFSFGYYERC